MRNLRNRGQDFCIKSFSQEIMHGRGIDLYPAEHRTVLYALIHNDFYWSMELSIQRRLVRAAHRECGFFERKCGIQSKDEDCEWLRLGRRNVIAESTPSMGVTEVPGIYCLD